MIKLIQYYYLIYPFFLFLPNLIINSEQQFVYLAYSLINGSLSLVELPPRIDDLSYFNGQYFWPLGIFPAIILMPFVAIFKTAFLQGFIQFPLHILNFWLVYKIAKLQKVSPNIAIWLAFFFIFGSIYTPVAFAPWSWFFAQVITTTLLLFALYEFLNKKRWILIGLAIALATLTRQTVILISLFFLIFIFQKFSPTNLFKFTLPILLAQILIFSYNYLRFGNIFENGYSYQIISGDQLERRNQGLFSIEHIPTNLYYMLLKTPEFRNSKVLADLSIPWPNYNPNGMSIFILSPLLFILIKTELKSLIAKASLATIILTAIPMITYYGVGTIQVGYRYALDFFPFIIILLIPTVSKVNFFHVKILILLGIIITMFFTLQRFFGI